MSQQNNNIPPNQEFDTQNPDPSQSNIAKDGTILEEVLEEFDPGSNAEGERTIPNEIDLEAYKARIKELEDEKKAMQESHARANAESYNAQRRVEQEAEKSKKFTLQKFAKELLEVVDNLERAIISVQNDDDADDAIMDGVKLTQKSLLNVLTKHGVEVVDPVNGKFDPELHEAVGIDPEVAPDAIGEVLQKGYTLNDRLLRPAMVRVGQ